MQYDPYLNQNETMKVLHSSEKILLAIASNNIRVDTIQAAYKTMIQMVYSYFFGRGGKIRTCDPLVPNQMRYQTALRPEVMQNVYKNLLFFNLFKEI